MIKTLKITSILTAIAAIVIVVFLFVFGLRGDPEIEKFLKAPGAIEKFKKRASNIKKPDDTISPLIRQAMAYALKLNPPKPKPKIPQKDKTQKKEVIVKKTKQPKIPRPKTQVSAKFEVVATVRYDQEPDKSLALLKIPAKENKWYQQGEQVGHLTIHQINDGSVVMYQNNEYNSEQFMPKPKKPMKSLLLSDSVDIKQPSQIPTPESQFLKKKTPVRPGRNSVPKSMTAQKSPKTKLPKSSIGTRKTRKRPKQPDPTPEQERQAITKSIADIKDIMNKPSNAPSEEERKKEREGWNELLEILQTQLDTNIEKRSKSTPESGNTPDKAPGKTQE